VERDGCNPGHASETPGARNLRVFCVNRFRLSARGFRRTGRIFLQFEVGALRCWGRSPRAERSGRRRVGVSCHPEQRFSAFLVRTSAKNGVSKFRRHPASSLSGAGRQGSAVSENCSRFSGKRARRDRCLGWDQTKRSRPIRFGHGPFEKCGPGIVDATRRQLRHRSIDEEISHARVFTARSFGMPVQI